MAVLVVGVAACEWAGWPFLQRPLQLAMRKATGVQVDVDGSFRAHLFWRPGLQISHLRLGSAQGVNVPYLLDGQDVDLRWHWSDIWQWQRGHDVLRLRRLHAGTLQAYLSREADGRASWQLVPATRSGAVTRDTAGNLPRIGSLAVREGHVVIDDRPLQARVVVELKGEAVSATRQAGDSAIQSTMYGATATGTYRALPLKLQAWSGAALPLLLDAADSDAPAQSVPLRVEGQLGETRLLFDGSAGALLGDWRMDGQLRLRGPSLARVGDPVGLTLPQTAPFDVAGRLSQAGGVWRLQVDSGVVGRSRLGGDFRYDTRVSPGLLTGRLAGPVLALADLGPAVGTPVRGQGEAPRPRPARVLPQRDFDLPSLRAMNADLQVTIDELDLGTPALAPLRELRTHVRLDGGVLRLGELQAVVAGGQMSGTTQLDGRGELAQWNADLKFRAVDIAGWIRGLQADGSAPAQGSSGLKAQRQAAAQGGDQPVQSYLTGAMTADLQVQGRGRSTAAILGSLQGQARLSLRDGTISHLVTELAGLDLAQALGVLIRGDQPLPLRCARVELAVQNGVATPRVAVLDNRDSTVRVDGHIDLRDESLALRAVARPKDFSPLSLRTPVVVGGTLSQPVVGIEGGRLATRGVVAAVLAAIAAPAAALIPFIDPGGGEKSDPCAAPAPKGEAPAVAASPASR